MFSLADILTVTFSLFAVIDILGNIPVVLSMKHKKVHFHPGIATAFAAFLMILFLFGGEQFLKLMGVDVQSFGVAGSIVIFIIGLEMILGRSFFKNDGDLGNSGSIIPLAFPMLAGAGTLTTIMSMRSVYSIPNIIIGILINLVIVYVVLNAADWLEARLGKIVLHAMNKFFGVILVALAIKIFAASIMMFPGFK